MSSLGVAIILFCIVFENYVSNEYDRPVSYTARPPPRDHYQSKERCDLTDLVSVFAGYRTATIILIAK